MLRVDYITNSIFNSRTDDKPSGIKLALMPEVRRRKTEGQPIFCRIRVLMLCGWLIVEMRF